MTSKGDNQEHTNISLIYDYTNQTQQEINHSIDIINTKLTTVIGFSGLLLRFSADLKNYDDWFILGQAFICGILVLAIIFSVSGYNPKEAGDVVLPKELRLKGEYYYGPEDACKRYIVDNWNNAIAQLIERRKTMARRLKLSIICLALASIGFGVHIVAASVYWEW